MLCLLPDLLPPPPCAPQVSKKLNLSRHNIKCFRDVNSRSIWGSADLRGFRAEDGTFLLLNFWRVMPPEHPHVSEHLISAPRDMSMFYRFLRPEFVRRQPAPLSPDANLLITNGTPDCQQQLDGLRDASVTLVTRTIADFADYLASQPAKAPAWQVSWISGHMSRQDEEEDSGRPCGSSRGRAGLGGCRRPNSSVRGGILALAHTLCAA